MMLSLLLGAALGAQAGPPPGTGPLSRFVICPGNRRCPPRPSPGRSQPAPPMSPLVEAAPGLLIAHGRRRDPVGNGPNMLLFATGEATLSAEARALLDRIAERSGDGGDVELLLEGHADGAGDDAARLALAGRRAGAAADYLIGRGVPAGRILAIGWGEDDQAAATGAHGVVVTVRRRPGAVTP